MADPINVSPTPAPVPTPGKDNAADEKKAEPAQPQMTKKDLILKSVESLYFSIERQRAIGVVTAVQMGKPYAPNASYETNAKALSGNLDSFRTAVDLPKDEKNPKNLNTTDPVVNKVCDDLEKAMDYQISRWNVADFKPGDWQAAVKKAQDELTAHATTLTAAAKKGDPDPQAVIKQMAAQIEQMKDKVYQDAEASVARTLDIQARSIQQDYIKKKIEADGREIFRCDHLPHELEKRDDPQDPSNPTFGALQIGGALKFDEGMFGRKHWMPMVNPRVWVDKDGMKIIDPGLPNSRLWKESYSLAMDIKKMTGSNEIKLEYAKANDVVFSCLVNLIKMATAKGMRLDLENSSNLKLGIATMKTDIFDRPFIYPHKTLQEYIYDLIKDNHAKTDVVIAGVDSKAAYSYSKSDVPAKQAADKALENARSGSSAPGIKEQIDAVRKSIPGLTEPKQIVDAQAKISDLIARAGEKETVEDLRKLGTELKDHTQNTLAKSAQDAGLAAEFSGLAKKLDGLGVEADQRLDKIKEDAGVSITPELGKADHLGLSVENVEQKGSVIGNASGVQGSVIGSVGPPASAPPAPANLVADANPNPNPSAPSKEPGSERELPSSPGPGSGH